MKALTAATLLRIRRTHESAMASKKRKESRPTHRLNEPFYEQVSRRTVHPVLEQDEHDGWICLAARFTMDHGWSKHWPSKAELTVDVPPAMTNELVPADTVLPVPDLARLNDRQIITDESLWPHWPRLYVWQPDAVARGGTPLGWVRAGDKPKAGSIRVRRPGKDDDLPYKDVTHLLSMGWRVRRDRLKER